MPDDNKYDIFISYSNKNRSTVHRYAKMLEQQGYSVWYDSKLHTGAQFSKEIVEAIKKSRLFLFFSSKDSNLSKWTRSEILVADKYGKQILPVKIDNTDYDNSIMMVLLPLQYVSLTDTPDASEKLLDSVKSFIGSPSQPLLPAPQPKGRRHGVLCAVFSLVLAAVASWVMMVFSGEHNMNHSLSNFVLFASVASAFVASSYIIFVEQAWNRRGTLTNLAILTAVVIFTTYTFMAFGLGFNNAHVFSINLPSIGCSLLALTSVFLIVYYKKIGYYLLCLSALLFVVGGYFWLGRSLMVLAVLFVTADFAMVIFTFALKILHNGESVWDVMMNG